MRTANMMRMGRAGALAAGILLPVSVLAEDRFDLDETYDMSADGTIELVTRDADVTIVGADRDDVHVKVHYLRRVSGVGFVDQGFRMEVDRQGDDLRIREVRPEGVSVGIGYLQKRYDVVIEAPAAVSLRVHGDDDDYDIAGINGAIALDADDGSIRLEECGGTEFDLKFQDGKLDMDGGAGSLRLAFDDGDAVFRRAAFSRIEASAGDGTVRLRGGLSRDGRYEFELDDGEVRLDVGDAGGDFAVTLADGSLELDGGRGRVDIEYDDGRARLRDTAFERLSLRANDGRFDFDAAVPPEADYSAELDDGSISFTVHGGGGRIETRVDDGRVRADDAFRVQSKGEHDAVYLWGDGDAVVSLQVNDGSIRLSEQR